MSTTLDTGTALYYPYLRINEDYLKFSLLYWDRIRRIVPRGAEWQFRDTRGVLTAADEGVVRNTSPSAYLDGAAARFRAKIIPFFASVRDTCLSRRSTFPADSTARARCFFDASWQNESAIAAGVGEWSTSTDT